MIKITIITILSLQTLILSVLLLLRKENKQTNALLGLVLFLFGLATISFSLFHGLFQEQLLEYIPYLRLELLFGLGPALFLYTKSVTSANTKMGFQHYLILLPAFLEFIYYRTAYFRDGAIELGADHMNLSQQVFIAQQWSGVIYSTVFMFLSVYELLKYKKWLKANFSYTSGISLQWIQVPIVCFVSFWVLWFILRLSDLLFFSGAYGALYYFPMYIILSIISLWIGFKGYISSKMGIKGFENSKKVSLKDSSEYKKIAASLKQSMQQEKHYLIQNLSLKMLSQKTGIKEKELSAVINQVVGVNFHEFVNTYRVNEFIERIIADESKQFTFLAHAYESGFASKSSFNSIFKKQTRKTPKEYFSALKDREK